MLKTIDEFVAQGQSFCFETTLSGRGYAKAIPVWREQGYFVKLLFLELSEPETALRRVAARVSSEPDSTG